MRSFTPLACYRVALPPVANRLILVAVALAAGTIAGSFGRPASEIALWFPMGVLGLFSGIVALWSP